MKNDNQLQALYEQSKAAMEMHQYDEMYALLNQAAEEGYRPAMVTLGRMYYNGKGVEPDEDKAIYWLTKAADLGSTAACKNLGHIYYDKGDTDENNRLAWKYYSASTEWKANNLFYVGKMIIENRVRNIGTIWSEGFDDEERTDVGISYYQDALDAKYSLAGLYLWKMYRMYGLTDPAEEFYKQGEQLMETPAEYNNWAFTLSEWGEHEKALPYIEKAMEMVGEDKLRPYMIDTYAEVLFGLGRLDEAKQAFDKCLAVAKNLDERRHIRETEEKIKQKFN